MGCTCENTIGFKEKLAEAKKLTEETGQTHVVYVHKAVGQVFMRKEKDLHNNLGICCYFLPDGTEVIYVPKTKKSRTTKKQDEAAPETIAQEDTATEEEQTK